MAKLVFDDCEVREATEDFFADYDYEGEICDCRLDTKEELFDRFDIRDIFGEYDNDIALTEEQKDIIYEVYASDDVNKKIKFLKIGSEVLAKLAREIGLSYTKEDIMNMFDL